MTNDMRHSVIDVETNGWQLINFITERYRRCAVLLAALLYLYWRVEEGVDRGLARVLTERLSWSPDTSLVMSGTALIAQYVVLHNWTNLMHETLKPRDNRRRVNNFSKLTLPTKINIVNHGFGYNDTLVESHHVKLKIVRQINSLTL